VWFHVWFKGWLGGYLLPQLGLALLACRHEQVPYTGRGQTVLATLDAVYGDDAQVLWEAR
jgi:hypothetical protein